MPRAMSVINPVSDLTLDWLHERAAEVDGCLIWRMAAAHGTDPQARIGGKAGKCTLVRRLLWELVHDRPFPKGRIATVKCKTPLCVHPEHIVALPKTAPLKGIPLTASHRANIAAALRSKSDLSDEAVREIRLSTEKQEVDAARHGIDVTYVSALRLYKARRDYGSPFGGGLA